MKSQNERGFSRVDLTVAVTMLAILAAWFGFCQVGERGRISRCAGNLKVLGKAMHTYADDHADVLPEAGIYLPETKISWDAQLFPYLSPNSAGSNSPPTEGALFLAAAPRLLCPSDTLARGGHPRTYAMAERNMAFDWPPTSDDNTGIGVWWDRRSIIDLLGNDTWETARKKPDLLPGLKLSVLPTPAKTILLSELAAPDNKVGVLSRTRILLRDQMMNDHETPQFHFNRFNYLMADGHVELLTGLQSGRLWTIKPGD